MFKKVVRFKMARETKGAVLYNEVDESGRPVQIVDGVIGNLYVRKHAFDGGDFPPDLEVVVTSR